MGPSNVNVNRSFDRHKYNRINKEREYSKNEKAVYTRLVAYLRPNKSVHEILRMCMGGDQLTIVMDKTTSTADLTTCKIHLNGVVSTKGVRFAASNVKYFCLGTPLKDKRYVKVKAKYIPQVTIDKYKLQDYIIYGWLYLVIYKGMYGIPEAGRLANNLLRKRLK